MNYTKELLEQHIANDLSYEAIGRIYGISGNAIKKACIRFKISISAKRKINQNEKFNNNSNIDKFSDSDFKNIIINSKGWDEISKALGYKGYIGSNIKKNIINRCSKLGIEPDIFKQDPILLKTKGELFANRKNWQSARSSIQKSARKIYMNYNNELKCKICGYNNHVEIAHIKSVSEHDDSSTIAQINSIDNLIGLCPNHHWEYDNGVLKI